MTFLNIPVSKIYVSNFSHTLPAEYKHHFQNITEYDDEKVLFCYDVLQKLLSTREIESKCTNKYVTKEGCTVRVKCPGNKCPRYFVAKFDLDGNSLIYEAKNCDRNCVNIIGKSVVCGTCNYRAKCHHGLLVHRGVYHQ